MLAVLIEFWSLLRKLGGLGLILMGFLDSSVIPTPGGLDLLTIVLAAGQKTWWPYYAAMAVAGSVIGGYLSYELGRKGGEEAIEKRMSKKKFDRVCRAFEKWGFGAVFVPTILPPPFPIGPIFMGAGALDYPLKKFLLALTAGRVIRFTIVAYMASRYGQYVIKFFSDNYVMILLIIAGLTAAGGLAFFLFRSHDKQTKKKASDATASGD